MQCDLLQKSLLSDPIQLQELTLASPCCPTKGRGGGWAERDVPAVGVPQARRVCEHTVPDPTLGSVDLKMDETQLPLQKLLV